MKHIEKHEAGQSIVIIVIAMVALAALAAIVADAGYSYVQQRQVQNAADAASMAASMALAQKQSYGEIGDTVYNYLTTNGIANTGGIKGWFVVQDASGNTHILNGASDKPVFPKGQYANDDIPPDTMLYQGVYLPVVGVYVDASKQFNTFFAAAMGFQQVQVKANSMGHVNAGVCSETNVFPVALDVNTFPKNPQTGLRTVVYEQDNPTAPPYTLVENRQISNGHGGYSIQYNNIGYVTWPGSPSNGDTTAAGLVNNMNNVSNSGTVGVSSSVNPDLPGSAGNMATSSSVQAAIASHEGGDPVILPVYDNVPGYGSSAQYEIIGFVSFEITAIQNTGNGWAMIGYFQRSVDAQAPGGCIQLGVSTVTENPPPPTQVRAIAGTVRFLPVVPNKVTSPITVSADVVMVLDTSGSMNNAIGNGDNTTKIQAAQSAMTTFLGLLQTGNTQGFSHQVGFVNFPQLTTSPNFTQYCQTYCSGHNPPCQYSGVSSQNYGDIKNWTSIPLGTNFTGISNKINHGLTIANGTPTAQGITAGYNIVMGSSHKQANTPVMILATDGLMNATIDGNTTGWIGSLGSTNNVTPLGKNPDGTSTYPACDAGAATDAYSAALTAKNNGVTIFTIGTGGDFDPYVLKALATPDANAGQQHYFTASNSSALNAAYTSIAQQVANLNGICTIGQKLSQPAVGATLTIKDPNGNTLPPITTLRNGEFIYDTNVIPGNYTVTSVTFTDQSTGLPYTTFTDESGGSTSTNPVIQAQVETDTYPTAIWLKTTVNPCLQ